MKTSETCKLQHTNQMKKKSYTTFSTSNYSNLMTWTGLSLKHLLLPNIDLFKVVSGKFDEVLNLVGIQRRYRRWMFTTKGPNGRYNRYLYRVLGRLHKYAKEGQEEKFFNLSQLLLKKSNVFKLLILWKTDRNWYKTYSVTRIEKVLRNYQRLILNDVSKFKFKRIWIPKTNGKMRPLSVPPYEWRMLTKSYNIFLTIWADGQNLILTPSQFGVLKGAGTAKAWLHISENLNKKFIYEFDLAKFFDLVPWSSVSSGMKRMKFPKGMITKCEKLMQSSMSVLMENSLIERIQLWKEIIKDNSGYTFWSYFT